MNETLLFLIPLMPLLCGVLNAAFGMRLPRLLSETLAVGGVLFAAAADQPVLVPLRRRRHRCHPLPPGWTAAICRSG